MKYTVGNELFLKNSCSEYLKLKRITVSRKPAANKPLILY